MFAIPSVDIKNRRCVKLVQGRPGTGIAISNDPVKVAEEWEAEGAEILHVVDLDAAISKSRENRRLVADILKAVKIPVEVGGGIRSLDEAVFYIEAGAEWIIIGTLATQNPRLATEIAETISPSRLIIAVDSRGGYVVTEGWVRQENTSALQLIRRFEPLKVGGFLFTNVDVEGTLTGIQIENIQKITQSTDTPIIYAGGISSLEDVRRLSKAGLKGAVVGRALYDGRFTLKEAKEAAKPT